MEKLLSPSILIATAEKELMTELKDNFLAHNFNVTQASSGDESISCAKSDQYDAIILDSSLPDISGIGVCTILRTKKLTKSTPIIMIAEQDNDFFLVKGKESGIDDFVVKNTAVSDLISRVKNLTKKVKYQSGASFLQYLDLKIDIANFKVTRGNRDIHLGPTEFKILKCLMEFPQRILSRDYIISQVWENAGHIEPRTIDVHINRLRSAVRTNRDDYSFIKTIRSSGYCLGIPSGN